jgi:hypothetical protein
MAAGGRWCGDGKGGIVARVDDGEGLLLSERLYGDVELSTDATTPNREASLAVRAQDPANLYIAALIPNGVPYLQAPYPFARALNGAGTTFFVRRVQGREEILARAALPSGVTTSGGAARLQVVANGSTFRVLIDGKQWLQVQDSTFATGRAGFRIYGDQEYPCDAVYESIQVSGH